MSISDRLLASALFSSSILVICISAKSRIGATLVCVRSGRKCMFCCALPCGTCKNSSRNTVDKITDPINEIADSVADTVDPSPICGESVEYNRVAFYDFIDTKLTQAFVASILRSDGGGLDDPWGIWWICVCCMSGRQYDLPGGAVGHEFLIYLVQRFGY